MLLAPKRHMSIFSSCQRCQEFFFGQSYRVSSENDGEKLLDIVVCYGCYIEASRLGLETEAVETSQSALH